MSESPILCEYTPKSWFHPRGIRKVLADITPRLPNVAGSLFLTFTIDPSLEPDPSQAFKRSRDKLRRVFHKLRKGVRWQGKLYKIDAPYCVKVEFHQSGWAHYHCIFLTRRFLPGGFAQSSVGAGSDERKTHSQRKGFSLPAQVRHEGRVFARVGIEGAADSHFPNQQGLL